MTTGPSHIVPNPSLQARIAAVRKAAEAWEGQLQDLSGRNPLLNYRHLKASTLDLTPDVSDGLNPFALDLLLAGRSVSSTALFPREENAREIRRRLSTIHRTAQINLEEKGIDTLFLAAGIASWRTDKGTPTRAPVVMIPLDIRPDGAGERRFTLQLSDDGEPHLNPVLQFKADEDFGAELSDDDWGPLGSYAAIRRLLLALSGEWRAIEGLELTPWVVVANFKYANMPMVEDLDKYIEEFARNDFVAAIAGVSEATEQLHSRIVDPAPNQPDTDRPENEYLVLDADASQHRAINRVLGGESIIIWGPPGTGKSQTIANLIASLAAAGKRVLFVAEKRAAIDVVVSRLRRAELGDLVMDLHGGIRSKRAFAQSIADSLGAIRNTPLPALSDLHYDLREVRRHLVDHVEVVHQLRQPYEITLFNLQARMLGIKGSARNTPPMDDSMARKLKPGALGTAKERIREWVELGGHVFAERHPEWSRSPVASPHDARAALHFVRGLRDDLAVALDLIDDIVRTASLPAPRNLTEWIDWLEALSEHRAAHTEYAASLDEYSTALEARFGDLLSLDLDRLRADLAPATGWAPFLTRLFSSTYRNARREVIAAAPTPEMTASDLVLLRAVEGALDGLGKQQAFAEAHVPPILPLRFDDALTAARSLAASLAEAQRWFPNDNFAALPPRDAQKRAADVAAQDQAASVTPKIHELERQLRDVGFGHVLPLVGGNVSPFDAADAVEYAWLTAAWEDIRFDDTRVATFSVDSHNRRSAEFIQLDRNHLVTTAARIRRRVAEHATEMMSRYAREEQLIRREAAKKARHLSPRRLLAATPHVLTAIRPCWTMSPLLVAELVPPEADLFDIVIFDEASQVPPAEAIGSLARAPQAVIAGDERQLPPTDFFTSHYDPDADDDSNELDEPGQGVAMTGDIESILDVAKTRLLRDEMLRWHYRSRDGRLIAFSNSEFYGDALTAFPDTEGTPPLSLHHVPIRPVQKRGNVSHPDEVAAVVDLAFEHARMRPGESLGVIAFGINHANNIEEEVRRRLRDIDNPDLEAYFSEAKDERFFVKNLERVQGDERDVIILSVGYHKAANGTLPYRFGPLNMDGGERRLNVAVTRARLHIHLVSSFTHHDMDPEKATSRGVDLLRQYIEFAASGGRELAGEASGEPLNPFELDVLQRLEERGIPVVPQYGVAGYRIDFACGHPDEPGRMVLAIEADGASYHSAQTARERDRLRQAALEDRGWTFHRIWSTNWFRNKSEELDRAVAAWRDAVAQSDRSNDSDEPVAPAPPPPAAESDPPPAAASHRTLPQPWIMPGTPITEYGLGHLIAIARWILSDGLLYTDDELKAEMRNALGYRRNGSRISAALGAAVRYVRAHPLD